MKSSERLSQSCPVKATYHELTELIIESGLGIREWAKRNEQSMLVTYELCLRALANDEGLRECVLGKVDHSAARVFSRTSDHEFDRFVGTTLAMQVLVRGLLRKEAIEHLSLELLDPFLDLRESRRVTRGWLSRVMSRRYRGGDKIYRFGELTRIAVLASSLLGYHDDDPIFTWAVENREGIQGSSLQQWSRAVGKALSEEGYPCFDLWVVRSHERDIVRRVDFDTDSLFCRRLLKDSVCEVENWSDIQYVNSPFFNKFVQSIGFIPKRLEDFSVDTFTRQARWFLDKPGTHESTYHYLKRFYMYIASLLPEEQNQFCFETGLPLQPLEHHVLFRCRLDECGMVLQNQLEPARKVQNKIADALIPELDGMDEEIG